MIGLLVIGFRIGAALLLLPIVVPALLAGKLVEAVFTLLVLALCFNNGDSDKH